MSPASVDALEVERYIGACLFSQTQPKSYAKNREVFHSRTQQVYSQNGYVNFHQPAERWAGGAPLISFAGPHRGRHDYNEVPPNNNKNHLARLAVHTQGAPLILTKSYNHRKSKPQRNVGNNNNNTNVVQQTKVFENSNNRNNKHSKVREDASAKSVDSISVISDESSGSQNSETCLPRIIKPRKRRKKERKPPPHLALSRTNHSQDEFSVLSASPNNVNTSDASLPNISLYLPFFDPPVLKGDDDLLGDISETPKLHHSFDEVEEVQDMNGNQPASTCQCRYCDPQGQIWDVDRSCYSPFLTPPKSFDFSYLLSSSYSSQTSDIYSKLSELSLNDEKYKPSFSRSTSSSSTSSSSSSGDLEVSTEIVTSLNGHRDLEIKFWLSSGAVEPKSTNNNSNVSQRSVCDQR